MTRLLDELSKNTLKSYKEKAGKDATRHHLDAAEEDECGGGKGSEEYKYSNKMAKKRDAGEKLAKKKLTRESRLLDFIEAADAVSLKQAFDDRAMEKVSK